MTSKLLILFGILILILILCPLLGGYCTEGFTTNTYTNDNGSSAATITTNQGNTYAAAQGSRGNTATASDISGNLNAQLNPTFDNYNHFTGNSYPTIFYGPNGGTARVIQTADNNYIVTTTQSGTTSVYYIDTTIDNSNASVNNYYGPNGGTASIITDGNGNQAVQVILPDGTKVLFTEQNTYVYNSQDGTINDTGSVSTNQYYGPAGGQATTYSGPQGNTAWTATGAGGNTYYGSNINTNPNTNPNINQYYGPAGGQATTYSGPAGNTSAVATGPGGNMYAGTTASGYNDYYNSLPAGIPASQIPSGQEDLYILKSQVVPPVCPACPEPIVKCPNDFDESKCPACPPCGRCPEPAFDCKKVPNYNAFNPDYLPVPVLNDFSTFGM